MSFKFIDKTADIRIRVEADDLFGMIEDSAEAFKRVMTDDKISCSINKNVEFNACCEEKVVFKFLEELLFLLDSEGFLISKVKSIYIFKNSKGEFKVKVLVCGDSNLSKYDITSVVKAVTYNDFKFGRTKDGLFTEITLDL